jgi:hypothetical protein
MPIGYVIPENITPGNYTIPSNPSWDDCGEGYRDIFTTGEFDVLGNFTWGIHSELGDKLGCYLQVANNFLRDSLNNITNSIYDRLTNLTTSINTLPGRIWDMAVNGLDSGLKKYLGFGLDDISNFLKIVLTVILLIIGLIVGFILLIPVLNVISIFLVEGIIIILTFGDKRNKTAWEQLKVFISYNIRYWTFNICLSIAIGIAIPDYCLHLIFADRWQLVSTKLFQLAFFALSGRHPK